MPLKRASLARPRHSRMSRARGLKGQKVIVKNGKIAEYRVDLKVTFILID
jgi:flavin-binding protein dodecin